MGQGPPRCPFPLHLFPLLLTRFVERHRHGKEAGSQSVGVVLGVKGYGGAKDKTRDGVGEYKDHLPEPTVF